MATYVLDARTANDHFPGIGRYVSNLSRALVPLLAVDETLVLLHNESQSSRLMLPRVQHNHVLQVATRVSPFALRQQVTLPRLLHRLGANMYHSPYYLMPYRPGVPTLLTVYDLIPELFPDYVSRQARLLFRTAMRMALRASSLITTISEATRADLLARYSVDAGSVHVVPLAADPAFHPAGEGEVGAVRKRFGLPRRYVLYVGSNKPHKNVGRLLDAWAEVARDHVSNTVLAMAGHWDSRYPAVRQRANNPALKDRVVFCGPVPDKDLVPLMTGATVFVFPSEYEGFGLPVIEAMACGTPVACANRSSLPEVTGKAAALFAPEDVASIVRVLQGLLEDPQWRQRLAENGLLRAREFSWDRVAEATLALYRRLR